MTYRNIHHLSEIKSTEHTKRRASSPTQSKSVSDVPSSVNGQQELSYLDHIIAKRPQSRANLQQEESVRSDTISSISLSDMPYYLPKSSRDSLYIRILSRGIDLSKVSRRATAYALAQPGDYWDTAIRDCVPIIETALLRNAAGQQSIPEESVQTLNYALDFLEDQLSETPAPLGKPEACSSMATIFLIEGADYSISELEMLASHFLAHSRAGNQHVGKLSMLIDNLPCDARRVMGLVRQEGCATDALDLVNRLLEQPADGFLNQAYKHLLKTTRTLRSELIFNPDIDVIRRPVLTSEAEALSKTAEMSQHWLEQFLQINRDICVNFPAGGSDLQIRSLVFQIATQHILDQQFPAKRFTA